MTPARALPGSFAPWLDLSSDDEILTLLALVKAALSRRGYVDRIDPLPSVVIV